MQFLTIVNETNIDHKVVVGDVVGLCSLQLSAVMHAYMILSLKYSGRIQDFQASTSQYYGSHIMCCFSVISSWTVTKGGDVC